MVDCTDANDSAAEPDETGPRSQIAVRAVTLADVSGATWQRIESLLDPDETARAVVGDTSLQFSLSHCNGVVACAVSRDAELGVDAEVIHRDAALVIAQSHFAAEEKLWLAAMTAADRTAVAVALWTLNKAFVKATGSGLAQAIDEIVFAFDPLRVSFRNPNLGDQSDWRFRLWPVGTAHQLALAWRGKDARRASAWKTGRRLRAAKGLSGTCFFTSLNEPALPEVPTPVRWSDWRRHVQAPTRYWRSSAPALG